MRSHFTLGFAALFAMIAIVAPEIGVEGPEANGAPLLLARASHESLYTAWSRPKHSVAKLADHATRRQNRRMHNL